MKTKINNKINKKNTLSVYDQYCALGPGVKKFIHKIWKDKSLQVGGVINYSSNISNGIKLFSQSMYSHTNFFDGVNKGLGAEDLKGIMITDYSKNQIEEFYYVTKQLNFDYLTYIFSFEYISSIFVKLGKFTDKNKDRFLTKFIQYVDLCESNNPEDGFYGSNLESILKINSGNILYKSSTKSAVNQFLTIKSDLKSGKIYNFDIQFYNKYFQYLKEFLLLGIVKFIILNYGKKYDLNGTLSTIIVPWSSIDLHQKEYFCSEFVAESLIYAGVYPFDINTKDPSSITPGDIMDMTIIFNKNTTSLFHIIPAEKTSFQKIELSKDSIIKNSIMDYEKSKLYFLRQKMIVGFISNLVGLTANKLSNQNNNKPAIKHRKFSVVMGILLLFVFGFYGLSFFSADIYSNQTDSGVLITSLLKIFEFLLSGISIFLKLFLILGLTYIAIFYLIPYLNKLYDQIKDFLKI